MVPRYVERTKISAPVRGSLFLDREEETWSRRWAQVVAREEEEKEEDMRAVDGGGGFSIYLSKPPGDIPLDSPESLLFFYVCI